MHFFWGAAVRSSSYQFTNCRNCRLNGTDCHLHHLSPLPDNLLCFNSLVSSPLFEDPGKDIFRFYWHVQTSHSNLKISFSFWFLDHICLCSEHSWLCAQISLLTRLGVPYVVARIKPGLAASNASVLPVVLTLQPPRFEVF